VKLGYLDKDEASRLRKAGFDSVGDVLDAKPRKGDPGAKALAVKLLAALWKVPRLPKR
jgi:hypothetical protein